jgi:hypothetical protein
MSATFMARTAVVALAVAAGTVSSTVPAEASAPTATPVFGTHIVAHLDLAAGQQPENITLQPDGRADVTFATARQVARIGLDGRVRILATLPAPADGGVNTPLLHSAGTFGITRRSDGALLFLYNTGTSDLTGMWQLRPGGTPRRIAALPANGLANGMAIDPRGGQVYISDSALGTVTRVSEFGGAPVVVASGGPLAPNGSFGANGVKVHNGAVWVADSERGFVARIPIGRQGRLGPVTVAATVPGVDDFVFTGAGDTFLAAINSAGQVDMVRPGGTPTIVLTRADGLQNPTSMAVRGNTVYVANAASPTLTDPNLLITHLAGRG